MRSYNLLSGIYFVATCIGVIAAVHFFHDGVPAMGWTFIAISIVSLLVVCAIQDIKNHERDRRIP